MNFLKRLFAKKYSFDEIREDAFVNAVNTAIYFRDNLIREEKFRYLADDTDRKFFIELYSVFLSLFLTIEVLSRQLESDEQHMKLFNDSCLFIIEYLKDRYQLTDEQINSILDAYNMQFQKYKQLMQGEEAIFDVIKYFVLTLKLEDEIDSVKIIEIATYFTKSCVTSTKEIIDKHLK